VNGCTVSVSAARGSSRTRLHTFVRFVRGNNPAQWATATPPSDKQRAKHAQQRREETAGVLREMTDIEQPRAIFVTPPPPRSHTDSYGTVLDSDTINLGDGLSPRGDTLSVVLEALCHGGRAEIDLGDLKKILSQLGSRITGLGGLPDEQRRHAEPALYAQILSRCTTVGTST
jgi:hypothetical protein